MRIPLDYYRILSVPVKATSPQLEQAYQDRLLQQPRREYSEQALEARQQLIQYSYQVLSDAEQRATYDAQFLLNMQPMVTPEVLQETESVVEVEETELASQGKEEEEEEETNNIPLANPTIEIAVTQIVGALILLHELGEYETVLSIGIDDFNRREIEQQPSSEEEVSLDITQEDLILVLTLAYMELGREQWHRREYEKAALSGQLGVDLLNQKSLFPHIQEELEQDLSKLRPYRVLELISQNPAQSPARTEGFQLLQSMLIQRQGIEGKGEDRSGLNFDQFLCFVQQLRTYLTSSEQQQLFDNESQEKSAIANYLAVYALLGRGFSGKQPELVLRAQRKLDYLSEKQDVSWEQAIAALLLGHTEKAIHKLKHSPDPSQLQQVQQHSLGSSDLLPGLCFYGEQWLVQDVLAQFSDLSGIELTLKEYFADRQVQAYLEELSPPTVATKKAKEEVVHEEAIIQNSGKETVNSGIMSLWRNMFPGEKIVTGNSRSVAAIEREMGQSASSIQHQGLSTATIDRNQASGLSGSKTNPGRKTSHQTPSKKSISLPLQPKKTRAVPASVIKKAQGKALGQKAGYRKKPTPATLWKGRLFVIGLIFGVGAIGYGGMRLLLNSPNKTANQAQLAIALNQPSLEMPPQKTKVVVPKPKPQLTFTEQSEEVIQSWLASKSAAFGKEHQIEELNTILAEPLLTIWQERAKTYQQENLYRQYDHKIVMRSAKVDPNDQNKATVEAEVKEVAQHYQGDQLDNTQSYDDNLLVRYQLVRRGDKWLINQAEVLETL